MKKLLLFIVFMLILISTSFALQNEVTSQVDIDALVNEVDYSLKLYYDTQELTENSSFAINSAKWIINDSSVITKTDSFVLEAIGGNLYTPQRVVVTISPTYFVGTLDNNDIYTSKIIPEIRNLDGGIINGSVIDTATNVTTINSELPAGFQKREVTLLSFVFQWRGDSSLPSGRYVSNITISYKVV